MESEKNKLFQKEQFVPIFMKPFHNSMQTTVRIPVLKCVQLFLKYHYGERLIVSEEDYPAIILRRMLEKFDKQDPALVRPSMKLNLGGYIDILIGKREFEKHGAFISNKNIKAFSDLMCAAIRQELYRWCNHPNATDDVVDYNIRRFQDLYGFDEDDMSFDSLKRWYYRERQRIQKRTLLVDTFDPQLFLTFFNPDAPLVRTCDVKEEKKTAVIRNMVPEQLKIVGF